MNDMKTRGIEFEGEGSKTHKRGVAPGLQECRCRCAERRGRRALTDSRKTCAISELPRANVLSFDTDEMASRTKLNSMPCIERVTSQEEKLQQIWTTLCRRMPELNNFRGQIGIHEGSNIARYVTFTNTISVARQAIDLFYDLCTLTPKNARGVGITLKHEIGHAVTREDNNNPLFKVYKEPVAELFAISGEGYEDLIDGFAVIAMYYKMTEDPILRGNLTPAETLSRLFNQLNIGCWSSQDFRDGLRVNFGKYDAVMEVLDRLPFTQPPFTQLNNSFDAWKTPIIVDVECRVKEIEHVLEQAYAWLLKRQFDFNFTDGNGESLRA